MRGIADVLYPEACVGCGRLARGGLCSGCLGGVPRLGPPNCARCGAPTAAAVSECRECRGRRFHFDRARQAVPFDSVVRAAIHRLKYRGEWSLARALALLVAEIVPPQAKGAVTWVPAGPGRLRERGFDHARLLAEAVATRLRLPAAPLLRRVRETAPQVRLPPPVRRTNLAGALACRLPPPPAVMVVDDVFTTGATAAEAARALKRAGAERVTVLAVARTLPPYRGPPL